MSATLRMDREAREHGRYLYRVYAAGVFLGSVARWEGERCWTMTAAWLPSIGRQETAADAGRAAPTRRDAVDGLIAAARDFGPLAAA